MDTVAMWIGYAAMVAGGIVLALSALLFAADLCFRIWHHGWNMADIMDATAEWRQAHPEKFSRWKKRNNIDEDA